MFLQGGIATMNDQFGQDLAKAKRQLQDSEALIKRELTSKYHKIL